MSFYTNVFGNVFPSPIDVSLFFHRLLKIFNMSLESYNKGVGKHILKFHVCLHKSKCCVLESRVPDHKRSTVWVPANCPTCSSWILHCECTTLPSQEAKLLAAVLTQDARDLCRRMWSGPSFPIRKWPP